MDPHSERFGQNTDFCRCIKFDGTILWVGQVDVIAKTATKGWIFVRDRAKAIGNAAVARMKDNSIAFLERIAQVVGRYALPSESTTPTASWPIKVGSGMPCCQL